MSGEQSQSPANTGGTGDQKGVAARVTCKHEWRSTMPCTVHTQIRQGWTWHHCAEVEGHEDAHGRDVALGTSHLCACGASRSRYSEKQAAQDKLLDDAMRSVMGGIERGLLWDAHASIPQESGDRLLSEHHRDAVASLDDQRSRSRLGMVRLTYSDIERWLQLPEGAQVQAMWEDPMRQSFCIRFHHDSLPPAAPGVELPELRGGVPGRRLVLSWEDDEGAESRHTVVRPD